MGTSVEEQRQQAFEEERIDSTQLEEQLERRQELKDQIDELKYGGDGVPG